MVDESKSA